MLQQSSRGSLCKCKDRDRERKGSLEDPKESERRLKGKEESGVLAAFLKKKIVAGGQGWRVQAREPTAE
jgi:hypothetical protein